jgi:hypothetical protein
MIRDRRCVELVEHFSFDYLYALFGDRSTNGRGMFCLRIQINYVNSVTLQYPPVATSDPFSMPDRLFLFPWSSLLLSFG